MADQTELTIEQLAELSNAALVNARALLDDAQALLDGGRPARAFSLAVLAAEEFGKYVMTVSAVLRRNEPSFWPKFWRRFRSHGPKYGTTVTADWLRQVGDDREVSELLDSIKMDLRDKMSGFYVDFQGGQIVTPLSAVTPERAAKAVDAVRDLVNALTQHRDPSTTLDVFRAAQRLEAVPFEERLQALVRFLAGHSDTIT